MHDRLFANPRVADAEGLAQQAAAIGLDIGDFRACLASERHTDEIRQAMGVGSAIGVNGTPTFLIGTLGADGKFKAAKVIAGAKPFSVFKEAIDSVSSAPAASDVPVVPVSVVALPGGWKAAE
jgi:predicted DsbA family dithiol-disulfide isomerase